MFGIGGFEYETHTAVEFTVSGKNHIGSHSDKQ